ncbi:MAG: M3 family metallopeptidase, partial [Puniceicoccales bacterium]|nr:M3 family metallopeptidase [Puniceicoccales bacterium]
MKGQSMDLESFNEVAPLRWHLLSAEYLQREIPLVIQRSQENLRVIESVKMSDVTFGNIIEALEVATNPLDGLWGQVCHLETVANDAAFRKIYNEYLGIVVEFHGSIVLNEAIWERVRAVHSQDRNRLNTIQRRLLDETYQSFHDCGADLPEEKKLRLKEVRKQLAEKTQKYSENVLDSTETWEKIIPEKDRSLLDGLPETILGILREDAFRKGHADAYRVTLHAPVYGPIMRYVRCDSLRQELWLAYSKIAYDAPYGNEGLIREILALREEKARLLGKKNFADYVLQRRMAKNGATALRFTRELHGKVLPFFQRDVAQLE